MTSAARSLYRDLDEKPTAVVYSGMSQQYVPAFTLHIRTSVEPKLLVEATRRAFGAVDANIPFFDSRTLAEHIQSTTLAQTLGASILSMIEVPLFVPKRDHRIDPGRAAGRHQAGDDCDRDQE